MITLFKGDKKERITDVPVEQIRPNPHQPRKVFSNESLVELAQSISRYGLIQPITLREVYEGYELIAGERRLRACRMLGMREVRSIIIEATSSDSAAIALIENLQRENLDYLDEADAYANLLADFGITQDELATRVGKTQATIANKIRILRLEPSVKKVLREYDLTERHARALLRLETEELRLKALGRIVKASLNVKQTEEYITGMLEPKDEKTPERPQAKRVFKDLRVFSNTINRAVDLMKQSGINANYQKVDGDNYIEYIVRIAK
ncbi:MAG: nucleoid occlusion protein [Eubacteriales bacterium]|nr:nucleoid occlusion protein [Eubacteriales bacterium]